MRVNLVWEQCSGHARCNAIAPDLFPLDEDGYSAVGEGFEVPPGQEELARKGVLACPERALTFTE